MLCKLLCHEQKKKGNLNHEVILACCHAYLSECRLRTVSFALRNKLQMPGMDASRSQGCWLLAYVVIHGNSLIHYGLFCGRASLNKENVFFLKRAVS